MQSLFTGLNPCQMEAVAATEGFVRIIAGAGSGKTRTLTNRYAYLVKAAGIPPSGILCVTFTNKAAGEMKRRVRELIGDGYDNSLITTYHGFCVRVLREDIHRLFYPKGFLILDETEQKKILSEIYTEMELKLDKASFERILALVHRLKSDERYVDTLTGGGIESIGVPQLHPNEPVQPVEIQVIRQYLSRQKKIFGLDFDDLIAFTFTVFQRYPEVADKWANRLYYIQVDEFQDSSRRELRLLQRLCAVHGNLFVVGDPDQNIYQWRGADMSILVDFDKTFPGTRTIFLNQNYRSSGHILTAANTLIDKNKNRIPKELFTVSPDGPEIIHLHAKSETEEGRFIADTIKQLTADGLVPGKIAVLYRAGFLSRFVEQALMEGGIPYEIFGSVRFYERMEIRDVLAYLSLLLHGDNPASDPALERVINTPRRSFGKAKMTALRAYAAEDGISLFAALRRYASAPVFARSGVGDFLALYEKLIPLAHTKSAFWLIDEILTRSGYEAYIRQNGSLERLDNLAEFKRTAWVREQEYGEPYTLELFLQQVALDSDREAEEEDGSRVKLMTIHAAKGLEFPVCFVCGMTDGIFPAGRTLEERKEEGLEEERRLCFVALTRAMERLYLTESEGTAADNSRRTPSRFLYDIGEENYTRIGVIPKELSGNPIPPGETGSPPRLSVGTVVNHPIFGRGTILETDSLRQVYYILFEKGGRKPVSMDYDFSAWQNLSALREAAMAAAQSACPTPATTCAEPIDTPADPVCVPETESIRQETVRSLPVPLPLPDFPDTATEDTEPYTPEEEPEGILSTDMFALPPSLPPAEETSIPPEESPDAPLPMDKARGEVPMRYRNAPWNQPVSGEENCWKRDDVPHTGWMCVDIIDLGEPVGVCRMCGHQIIRYVHVMQHPDYPRTIGAGCVCAGRMEGDIEKARERENAFKNLQSRRETFLRLPRKKSRNGNVYVKYKGEIITLLKDRFQKGYYKTVLRGTYSRPYPTETEALLDAFTIIDGE